MYVLNIFTNNEILFWFKQFFEKHRILFARYKNVIQTLKNNILIVRIHSNTIYGKCHKLVAFESKSCATNWLSYAV